MLYIIEGIFQPREFLLIIYVQYTLLSYTFSDTKKLLQSFMVTHIAKSYYVHKKYIQGTSYVPYMFHICSLHVTINSCKTLILLNLYLLYKKITP